MKKLENIDKIFSEGLQNYERQPRPQAWEKLEARLQKSERKVLPIWWKYASAASVALLLGAGGYWFAFQKNSRNDVVAVTKKAVIIEKQHLPILEKTIPQMVKVEENNQPKTNLTLNHKSEKVTKNQFAQLLNQQIIKVENIEQITKLPTIESKNIEEQNTIVLVLENTKPKVEEETIVLNMVETKPEVVAQTDLNDNSTKKETRLSKIWQQLKRAKNGENVNWSEVGIKPQKMLARADAKIENVLTKGENNEK
jgi:hypothetical protein